MKAFYTGITLFFLVVPMGVSAVPELLKHQGRIIEADNNPMSGVTDVTFGLYTSSEGGTPVWEETLSVVFDDGHYTVLLGTTESIETSLFEASELYLGVSLSEEAEMLPRMRVASVPYAFIAQVANSVDGEVNATGGLSIGGNQVIDSDGNWAGPMTVQGEITIASTDMACNENNEGSMRWNSTDKQMEVCTGTQWSPMGGSGGSGVELPEITSLSPAQIEPEQAVDITISGSGFQDGCEVYFETTPSESLVFNSENELVASTDNSLTSGTYYVRVINPSGLRVTLEDALIVDAAPTWTTSEGSLGELLYTNTGEHFTLEASDPEGQDLTYTMVSGDLPPVLSLDTATGVISGNLDEVEDDTTYEFTVRVSDTAPEPNTVERVFSITIVDRVGQGQESSGESCKQIMDVGSSMGDGIYWVDPNGGSSDDAFRVYCDMTSDGGGWALQAKTNGSGTGHENPSDNSIANLLTPETNSSGTFGDTRRILLGRFYRFTCGSTTRYSYLKNTSISVNAYWPGDTSVLAWRSAYSATPSDYTENSAPDCGSPTCDGPSYAGRNWMRQGNPGCGLYGNYSQTGTWWIK